MLLTTSSLCPGNEHHQSVNNLRPSILENQRAMRLQWSILVLSATFVGNYTYDKIVTMFQNDRQRSVHHFWPCILDNVTGKECRCTTMNQLEACIGKNETDDIASAFYNWAPTVRELFMGRRRTLNSNTLHYAVSKWSFTWSVIVICPCIQLHKYACNVLLIWYISL